MPKAAGFFGIGLAIAALLPVMAQKNPASIEFVTIQPGEFVMGCLVDDNGCDADEKPAHRIQITKAFELGKYEVTQTQWQSVMGSNPSAIKGGDHPVDSVSKNDAHDFIARLNALNDGYRYRLPTEAEWEYAARAGATNPPSPAELDAVAWYAANSEDESHPVGQKKPNAWGLYDMLGNVREWVEDLYSRDYYGASPAADPTGPAAGQNGPPPGQGRSRGRELLLQYQPPQGGRFGGGRRGFGGAGRGGRQLPIMRGGAWDNPAGFVRFTARYHYYGPTLRFSDTGFRVAREAVRADGGSSK